jgi:hypothetical protein
MLAANAARAWARLRLRDKAYANSKEDAMKRTKRTSEPRTSGSMQPIAADELVKIKGGATAIEYGLVLVQPPTK